MEEENFTDQEMQLVVFKLGREEYAVSILQVQEIKRMTDITRVPYTPSYIRGVMNLRGSVLPVLDLKRRLSLQPGEVTDDTRIVIVKVEEITVGLIVDAVSEVLAISHKNVESSQSVVSDVAENYLDGVGKLDNRLLILLNLESIIGIKQDNAKVS